MHARTQLRLHAVDEDLVLLVEIALARRLGYAATAVSDTPLSCARRSTRRTHPQLGLCHSSPLFGRPGCAAVAARNTVREPAKSVSG